MPRYTVSRLQDNFPGWDYSDDEREFLIAIEKYKREARRPHPSWREVLKLLWKLGYRKVGPDGSAEPGPKTPKKKAAHVEPLPRSLETCAGSADAAEAAG